MTLEHRHDLSLEGIEFAGSLGTLALLEGWYFDPFGDGQWAELKLGGNLGNVQLFLIMKEPNLTECLIIDHLAPPSNTRQRIWATDWACPARSWVGAGDELAGSCKESTW